MDVIIESNKALSEQVQQLGWAFAISVFLIVVVVSILVATLSFQVYKDKLAREDAKQQRKEHQEMAAWVQQVLTVELAATRSSLDRSTEAFEKIATSMTNQATAFDHWQTSHREIMTALRELISREARIERHVKDLPRHLACRDDKAKPTATVDRTGYP